MGDNEASLGGEASSRKSFAKTLNSQLPMLSSHATTSLLPQRAIYITMALNRGARPVACCLQCTRHERIGLAIRSFATTERTQLATESNASSEPPPPPAEAPRQLDPFSVSTARSERKLMAQRRLVPIGSRRRRAAMTSSANIPFPELPYQCFQEARTFLREDREEKLDQIRVQRERMERLQAASSTVPPQDEWRREKRVYDMRRRLEDLKILADINDPVVKRKFEDGQGTELCSCGRCGHDTDLDWRVAGDMTKPIYRHLADLKWRSYKRKILVQRITQMNVVPDVLPAVDPIYANTISFGPRSKKIQHGDFVLSTLSEQAPTLHIQPFDKGKRLVTIAVVNPDVPDVEKDAFGARCHFLACNIEISPTDTLVKLGDLNTSTQVIQPWLPAFAQKGTPYQRMSIFILQQPASDDTTTVSQTLDVPAIKEAGKYTERQSFLLRSFVDKYALKPVGVDLFRTLWDEGTADVMQRAGIVGWNVEFKRMKVEPLPYKRKSGERYR